MARFNYLISVDVEITSDADAVQQKAAGQRSILTMIGNMEPDPDVFEIEDVHCVDSFELV